MGGRAGAPARTPQRKQKSLGVPLLPGLSGGGRDWGSSSLPPPLFQGPQGVPLAPGTMWGCGEKDQAGVQGGNSSSGEPKTGLCLTQEPPCTP